MSDKCANHAAVENTTNAKNMRIQWMSKKRLIALGLAGGGAVGCQTP